jgi:hypothetical protein
MPLRKLRSLRVRQGFDIEAKSRSLPENPPQMPAVFDSLAFGLLGLHDRT